MNIIGINAAEGIVDTGSRLRSENNSTKEQFLELHIATMSHLHDFSILSIISLITSIIIFFKWSKKQVIYNSDVHCLTSLVHKCNCPSFLRRFFIIVNLHNLLDTFKWRRSTWNSWYSHSIINPYDNAFWPKISRKIF